MSNRQRQTARYGMVFGGLLVLFCIAVIWNINTGSVRISLPEIHRILFLREDTGSGAYNIIWKIRLPRMLTAAVLGGALSLSGYLLQTFFRNPIAGPFILGISSGAKMFLAVVTIACSGTAFSASLSVTMVTAFVGSMLSMLFVLAFAGKVQNMSLLLLVGVMISYICSAVTDFLINFAKESDIANLTYWSLGSFSGTTWGDLRLACVIVLPAALCCFLLAKPISAYALGEGYAKSMGLNVRVFRWALILLSSLLSACVTALAGPISFVGIAVPHIARLSLGTQRPQLMLPAVFLGGGVFCMFCDLAARTLLSPIDLSLSTITSVIGAPLVIYLMLRRNSSHE